MAIPVKNSQKLKKKCQTLQAFKRAFIDYIMNWLSAVCNFYDYLVLIFIWLFSLLLLLLFFLAVIFSHQLF